MGYTISNVVLCVLMAAACSKKNSLPSSTGNAVSHTYYVSPSGSDANAGTINEPLRGINTALNKANAGDTILVRTGTYHENCFFQNQEDRIKALR